MPCPLLEDVHELRWHQREENKPSDDLLHLSRQAVLFRDTSFYRQKGVPGTTTSSLGGPGAHPLSTRRMRPLSSAFGSMLGSNVRSADRAHVCSASDLKACPCSPRSYVNSQIMRGAGAMVKLPVQTLTSTGPGRYIQGRITLVCTCLFQRESVTGDLT